MDIHNHDFDLKSYLNKIKLTKNHLLFISLPTFIGHLMTMVIQLMEKVKPIMI